MRLDLDGGRYIEIAGLPDRPLTKDEKKKLVETLLLHCKDYFPPPDGEFDFKKLLVLSELDNYDLGNPQ